MFLLFNGGCIFVKIKKKIKDSGTSPALIILGAVGAVLIVLLLIGAAAQ